MSDPSSRPAFDLPIAVLTAGVGLRMAALLPLIVALWAAIAWALLGGTE